MHGIHRMTSERVECRRHDTVLCGLPETGGDIHYMCHVFPTGSVAFSWCSIDKAHMMSFSL